MSERITAANLDEVIKRNEVIEEQMKQSASLIWSKYNPMQINSPIQLALQILRPYGLIQLPIDNHYGQYTKELWIDRRENSKSLAWSSILLALNNIKEVGAVVDRPKALGDIRGVTYIYGMFYRFGLIDMPDKVNGKMKRAGRQM